MDVGPMLAQGSALLLRLTERWQLHQIILGDRLQMSSGFAPGAQPPDDYERIESFFPQ
jgi:hypothetical protein